MLLAHINYNRGRSDSMPHLRLMTKTIFGCWLFSPCYVHGKFTRFLLFDLIQVVRLRKYQYKIRKNSSGCSLNLFSATYLEFLARHETVRWWLFEVEYASQNTLIDLLLLYHHSRGYNSVATSLTSRIAPYGIFVLQFVI